MNKFVSIKSGEKGDKEMVVTFITKINNKILKKLTEMFLEALLRQSLRPLGITLTVTWPHQSLKNDHGMERISKLKEGNEISKTVSTFFSIEVVLIRKTVKPPLKGTFYSFALYYKLTTLYDRVIQGLIQGFLTSRGLCTSFSVLGTG